MSRYAIRVAALLPLFFLLAGCASTPDITSEVTKPAQLAQAEMHFEQGDYSRAMRECIDLGHLNPHMPGLAPLQNKISVAIWEERARTTEIRKASLAEKMKVDMDLRKHVPETYGERRGVNGETAPMRSPSTEMDRALQMPVTVHLDGVNLSEFILAVGADENINIIADNLDDTKTMTLHAENVPLKEILDYVARNLGVTFSVGNNMIWATLSAETTSSLPLETRMYRLRKGLSSEEVLSGPDSLGIIEAITRFVPAIEGSDIFFSNKAHVLIVKNTRENLSKVEDIIEALDISPPQVLIEARFISTSITDLRELGIDWVLNSSVGIGSEKVIRNGSVLSADTTAIAEGASAGFTAFPNEATGLNFTYQGLLTDPMFEAVLHALETSGESRTLSVPKVTTVNNRPASIRVGEDFRYYEEYETDLQRIDGGDEPDLVQPVTYPTGTPELEELGIELLVTPSVGADLNSVSLALIPEISDFVRWEYWETWANSNNNNNNNNSNNDNNNNNSNNNNGTNNTVVIKLPIFRRSRIETEIVVQSGETIVMGGLVTSVEDKGEERIPVISSIPLIGALFRHNTTDITEQNLLIFVTATILSERGEDLVPVILGNGPPVFQP